MQKAPKQQQLFPINIELNNADSKALGSILDDVRLLGIEIEPFGKNTFIVQGLATYIDENSVKEVIAMAKSKPGFVSYGSGGGTGSSDHLAGEYFALMAGLQLLHVPYKSGPQAMTDLIGGQLSIYMGGVPVNLPMIKTGKLRPLGVSSLKRIAQLPDVPAIAEAGVPGFEVNVWYGLFAPRGTSPKIIAKISADVSRIVKAPEMRERLAGLGADAEGTAPEAFKNYFRADVEKWAKVVKAAKVSAE